MKFLLCTTATIIALALNPLVVETGSTMSDKIESTVVPNKIVKSLEQEETQAYKIQKTESDIKNEKQEELQSKLNQIKTEEKMEWYLEYKELMNEYAEWCEASETIYDVFTEEEIKLICRAVETECYQQDFESKVNVASVIFNRIEHGGEFGKTVNRVITKPNQFAYGRKELTEDTILAVMYAFEIEDTTDGCLAFRSDKHPKKWYSWELQFVDEAGHGFYK